MDPAPANPLSSDRIDDQTLKEAAFHEAAHVAVAVAMGVKVTFATIKTSFAAAHAAGSLGHVCVHPHPDPGPEDGWPNSHWVETVAMTLLAGYLIEDLLWPEYAMPRGDVSDHLRVMEIYRTFEPRDPAAVLDRMYTARDKCEQVLHIPTVVDWVEAVANGLLANPTMHGGELYRRFFNNRCSALHPNDPDIMCSRGPHPGGFHLSRAPGDQQPIDWPSFQPPSRVPLGSLPPNLRALRNLNRGGRPRPLTKAWADILDRFPAGAPGERGFEAPRSARERRSGSGSMGQCESDRGHGR